MAQLDGRCALITGGASGIGLATARRLVDAGARVTIADLDDDAGERAASELGVTYVRTDVTDPRAVTRAFRRAAEVMEKIDVAHLNAGVTTGESDIAKLTDAQYRRILGVNIDGVVFGSREAVRAMERAGGGAIVVTASLAGVIGFPPDPIYTLTKHAVVGLVRALADQLRPKGITINAVCPGIVETPLVGEEAIRYLRERGFPLIPPEEIADAVATRIAGDATGDAWVCQPGREPERFEFRGVPGPRTPGAEGKRPPGSGDGPTDG